MSISLLIVQPGAEGVDLRSGVSVGMVGSINSKQQLEFVCAIPGMSISLLTVQPGVEGVDLMDWRIGGVGEWEEVGCDGMV